MLSLLAQRVALRAPALAFRANAPLFALTRTFVTTPRVAFPPAGRPKSSSTVKARTSGTKKASTTKKAPSTKVTTKKAAPKKKVAAKKKAEGPKKVTIAAADKPPKRPPTNYGLFMAEWSSNQTEKPVGPKFAEHSRECAARWAAMSDAQKQPYTDQSNRLREQYKKDLAKWFETTSREVQREVNKRVKARGGTVFRNPVKQPHVQTAFFRFAANFRDEFRKTWTEPATRQRGINFATESAKAAGAKWRSMSDAEKAPFIEATQRDRASASTSA